MTGCLSVGYLWTCSLYQDFTRTSFSIVCIPTAGFSYRAIAVWRQYSGDVGETWISFAAPAQGWDIWECCIHSSYGNITHALRYVSCYSDDFFVWCHPITPTVKEIQEIVSAQGRYSPAVSVPEILTIRESFFYSLHLIELLHPWGGVILPFDPEVHFVSLTPLSFRGGLSRVSHSHLQVFYSS